MKNIIKNCRKKINMTQQELAERVEVTSRTIISIETEQYNPSLMLAYKIAQVFNVTVEELCCLKENKAKEEEKYEQLKKQNV